jgi:hypothetical protein
MSRLRRTKEHGPAPSDLWDPCPGCGKPRYTSSWFPRGKLCGSCTRKTKPRGVVKQKMERARAKDE